jgi:hypothetical protein
MTIGQRPIFHISSLKGGGGGGWARGYLSVTAVCLVFLVGGGPFLYPVS